MSPKTRICTDTEALPIVVLEGFLYLDGCKSRNAAVAINSPASVNHSIIASGDIISLGATVLDIVC